MTVLDIQRVVLTFLLLGGLFLPSCGASGGADGVVAVSPPPPPPLPPPPPPPTGIQSLTVDSVQRWMNVNRANSVQDGSPLVILLHGGFGSMRNILEQAGNGDWVDLAAEQGFLLIAPNGTNTINGGTFGDRQHWNDQRAPYSQRDSNADDVSFFIKRD